MENGKKKTPVDAAIIDRSPNVNNCNAHCPHLIITQCVGESKSLSPEESEFIRLLRRCFPGGVE